MAGDQSARRMSGRFGVFCAITTKPALSNTRLDPTNRPMELASFDVTMGQASRTDAPLRRAKSTPAATRAWVSPLPRAPRRRKKQEIAQTAGSVASAFFVGAELRAALFHCATSRADLHPADGAPFIIGEQAGRRPVLDARPDELLPLLAAARLAFLGRHAEIGAPAAVASALLAEEILKIGPAVWGQWQDVIGHDSILPIPALPGCSP